MPSFGALEEICKLINIILSISMDFNMTLEMTLKAYNVFVVFINDLTGLCKAFFTV